MFSPYAISLESTVVLLIMHRFTAYAKICQNINSSFEKGKLALSFHTNLTNSVHAFSQTFTIGGGCLISATVLYWGKYGIYIERISFSIYIERISFSVYTVQQCFNN